MMQRKMGDQLESVNRLLSSGYSDIAVIEQLSQLATSLTTQERTQIESYYRRAIDFSKPAHLAIVKMDLTQLINKSNAGRLESCNPSVQTLIQLRMLALTCQMSSMNTKKKEELVEKKEEQIVVEQKSTIEPFHEYLQGVKSLVEKNYAEIECYLTETPRSIRSDMMSAFSSAIQMKNIIISCLSKIRFA